MEENLNRPEAGVFSGNTPSAKNKLYDPHAKPEAARDKENVFNVSDRMLEREKETSKKALQELWLLKKTSWEKELRAIDMLIDYYQKKLDSVRLREERLKTIGSESLKLIEEKRKLQEESTHIVQEQEACVAEINYLRNKQEKLKARGEEIKVKSGSIASKLTVNEKLVMDNLSNIILARQPARPDDNRPPAAPAAAETAGDRPPAAPRKPAERTRFPKSIVKTDRGRILGEYFYDPKLYRNTRNYIFNGRYFAAQVMKGLELQAADPGNDGILADLLLMATDIQSRLKTKSNIYLEFSTREILNAGAIDEFIENIRERRLQAAGELCRRLARKIEVLGPSYELMLAEQIRTIAANDSNASQA